MLLKSADTSEQPATHLKGLLARKDLTEGQRKRIATELAQHSSGAWGEQSASYHLDLAFGASKNIGILHDLRLSADGFSAQIDHLFINRCREFLVLETKNYGSLEVDMEGVCRVWIQAVKGKRGYQQIVESPLLQAERHADILSRSIKADWDLPEYCSSFSVKPLVLVSDSCQLKVHPKFKENYVRMEQFSNWYDAYVNKTGAFQVLRDIPRMCSGETVRRIGERLADMHNPPTTDWAARFGLEGAPADSPDDHTRFMPPPPTTSSIPEDIPAELHEHISEHTDGWALSIRPSNDQLKALKSAGYRARRIKGEWVWSRS